MDIIITAGFFASLSIALFIWSITLHKKNERIEHGHQAAVTKIGQLERQLENSDNQQIKCLRDTVSKKDGEINRQKKEIEKLHKDLDLATPKDIEPDEIPEPPWNRPKPFQHP
jgi:peptidoglycan hydrolase CwlO-like protein